MPAWTAVLHDWVTTVDHKKIGIMYVLMAVVFLVVAGVARPLLLRLAVDVARGTTTSSDRTQSTRC